MDGTRVIRNPRWGNAVVGTLVGVNVEAKTIVVRLDTDVDAERGMWEGPIASGWVLDAMVAVDRKVAVVDGRIYLIREV